MRYQGKLTGWKDDQGFGFVIPNGGGVQAFVHIKAFSSRSRRPVEGDLITYEVTTEKSNRPRASNIRLVGERVASATSSDAGAFGTGVAVLFCSLLVLAALAGWLPFAVLEVYLVASVITFFMYALDKSAARNDMRRTKESTLHLLGLIGGWPGGLFAQKWLRHKSQKREFQTAFWTTVVLNCCVLGWLLINGGSAFVRPILGAGA